MTFHRRSAAVFILLAFAVLLALPSALRYWNDYRCSALARQCRSARNKGEWDNLRLLAADWTSRDPNSGDAWFNRGMAATGLSQWSDAADHFWNVPDASSQVVPAMIELSKISFTHLNQPLKGEAACERILRINPLATGAHQQLIWYYAMTLQRAKLRQQILKAIELGSEPREAFIYYFLLYSLKSEEAVELNTRWLEDSPNSELFLVARVINSPDPRIGSPETPELPVPNKESGEATQNDKVSQVSELLTRFPHNLELIAYLAEERFTRGDFVNAAEILKNAPESAAQDSRFWRFKGWLHEANGELQESVAAYRQSLALHPTDWNTMYRLTVVERRADNHPEVKKLTELLQRGNEARQRLRKEKAVEIATPEIMQDLASLFRDCGDVQIATAMESRLANARPK